jgi:D-alanyl-D-alanine endopeptidase (penicillin-binding protein 7)
MRHTRFVNPKPIDIGMLGAPDPRDHMADLTTIRRWLRCSLH